jgi:hypothetical protein
MMVHVITMPVKKYYKNWGIITDWFCMMNVKLAMSGDDGGLGPNEYDIVRDNENQNANDDQNANFFFTNPRLACLFKMRFG